MNKKLHVDDLKNWYTVKVDLVIF